MNPAVMTIGRFLLVLIFLIDGVQKAMDVGGTADAIASKGWAQPHLLATLTILAEIGGSLLVIFNRFTVPGALALAGVCLATGIFSYNFWVEVDPGRHADKFNQFMMNIALAGAFLTIAAAPALEILPGLRRQGPQVEGQSGTATT
jgi:uncharacterized membrane protein YphA (DoxX/SURF4 family)